MPAYDPGDLVNLRFEGDAATAELIADGASYTVAGGGLQAMADGGLIAVVALPAAGPRDVPYEFRAGGQTLRRGVLRVRAAARHDSRPPVPEPPRMPRSQPGAGPPVTWS